ncbi:M1 family metallopeptidase [Streptomyces sp. HNM0663]|uniref:Aminopeptidase N n=1 Tax=Streptomyces chengmaiensis TaxID=3040919 RepID=A0ABT6HTB3_9ACTN|nr:M1 family metallopeptidase [Streptomyces chengmaiensis]MDH2391962.1 M1 family metallopeptidase [Streptomyces chengmaiensis]
MPHTSPPSRRPSARRRLRVALLTAASAALVAAALPERAPLGIGDPLFPGLGNPGYDVVAYDIALTYHGDNAEPLDAITKIDAWATQPLDRINLDFTHGTVRSVRVNGAPAEFAAAGEDLVVEPAVPLTPGQRLRIAVDHTSDPRGDKNAGGWVRTGDGLAMANQADAAHRVFPCNDHPADKAYFTIRITAPKELTAVANGVRTARTGAGDHITWSYRGGHPMATELAQVSIGRSAVLKRTGPRGLPLRDVVPAADARKLEPWLDKTPAQLAWMEKRVGPYPFETYGVLIADARTGFELETQTLSLFERGLFTEPGHPEWYVDSIMVHELAHQWFGNSVSLRRWSDLWLSEGHATWYESLYAEEHEGYTLERRMRHAYTQSDAWRADGGPPAAPKPAAPGQKLSLFRPIVYDGSALVLYALRQEIGAAAFDRLQREWVRAHRDSTASTADFTSLASDIAGRDLSRFFQDWLYGKRTPPMPGHPDWKTGPATGARQPADALPAAH